MLLRFLSYENYQKFTLRSFYMYDYNQICNTRNNVIDLLASTDSTDITTTKIEEKITFS